MSIKYRIWSDGTVAEESEFEAYYWMSDDFEEFDVDLDYVEFFTLGRASKPRKSITFPLELLEYFKEVYGC